MHCVALWEDTWITWGPLLSLCRARQESKEHEDPEEIKARRWVASIPPSPHSPFRLFLTGKSTPGSDVGFGGGCGRGIGRVDVLEHLPGLDQWQSFSEGLLYPPPRGPLKRLGCLTDLAAVVWTCCSYTMLMQIRLWTERGGVVGCDPVVNVNSLCVMLMWTACVSC